MPAAVAFDEVKDLAGREVGVSPWLEMDQGRIDAFAGATDDHQWIHVDGERARAGPFGSTIAHGFLTLSLLPAFTAQILEVRGVARSINYGLDRLRFLTPVRPGDRVRGRLEILAVSDFPGGGLKLETRSTVEVDGADRPACVAEGISVLYPEPPPGRGGAPPRG